MTRVRIEINHQGAREILESPEVKKLLQEQAERIRDRAIGNGNGLTDADYEASAINGRNRAHGSVITATPHAMHDNQEHNSLLKAVTG